jgi:hypothetical protein
MIAQVCALTHLSTSIAIASSAMVRLPENVVRKSERPNLRIAGHSPAASEVRWVLRSCTVGADCAASQKNIERDYAYSEYAERNRAYDPVSAIREIG